MRLLYFHQHFSTPSGAVGQRSYEMARRFIERGHSVTLVCGSYKGGVTGLVTPFSKGVRRGLVDGIDIIEFDLSYANQDNFVKRTWTFLKFALNSLKLVFVLDYDVVFATTTPLTVAIPGILARWLRRKPFIFEVRDLWPELPKAMGVIKNPLILGCLSLLERASYHSANELIALSPGMSDGIVRCGIPKHKVHLVSNGCDFHMFENLNPSGRPCGVRETDLMAVYAGTHGIANGLDALLDTAVILQQRGRTDIKFVLVGDGKLKRELQQRALKEHLDNVLFLDSLPKPILAGLMLTADIGLQILANVPAFYEGTSPNKFFDYIAAGLPVLMNYPGWLAEKIVERNCGLVASAGDSFALSDALEWAQDHRTNLKIMGNNAYQLAVDEFDRDCLADSWSKVVEKVKLKTKSV